MSIESRSCRNKDPHPVPFHLPDETLDLARLAIERITSVDRTTEIAVHDTDDIAESIDSTWIVSGQSPVQRDMIRFLPKTKALYVEGAFRVWLREAQGGVLFDGRGVQGQRQYWGTAALFIHPFAMF